MTARQLYEFLLIELNKVEAPSLLLEDYNYFLNKAVNNYINKRYNLYDLNQQTTDDLRVLKGSVDLTPLAVTGTGIANAYKATYEVTLPPDYFHILNCIAEYTLARPFKCYDPGDKVIFGVRRLTADMRSKILNNAFLRPDYKRPYFYIHNVVDPALTVTTGVGWSVSSVTGTNYPYTITFTDTSKVEVSKVVNDIVTKYYTPGGTPTLYKTITQLATGSTTITSANVSTSALGMAEGYPAGLIDPQRFEQAGSRDGNNSTVRMEIGYGKDNTLFVLSKVYVDYLKVPQHIRLTQTQIDLTADTSQHLEFPDYVCQEIIKELTMIILENSSDPRLQSNIPINQSIPNGQAAPQQQQQQGGRE